MTLTLKCSVATLAEPIMTSHITPIMESILRSAHDGEGDIDALQRIGLLEVALAPGYRRRVGDDDDPLGRPLSRAGSCDGV